MCVGMSYSTAVEAQGALIGGMSTWPAKGTAVRGVFGNSGGDDGSGVSRGWGGMTVGGVLVSETDPMCDVCRLPYIMETGELQPRRGHGDNIVKDICNGYPRCRRSFSLSSGVRDVGHPL